MSKTAIKKCVILIPALNPPKQFLDYAKQILKNDFFDLIVVNDGSSKDFDDTFNSIKKLKRTVVIKHAINKGKGASLKTGFTYFCQHYHQNNVCGIVTADCDGQHLTTDVIKVAQQLTKLTGGV